MDERMSSGQEWFFRRGAEAVGPVTFDALRGMLQSGQVREEELVWTDGMSQWMPAASLGAFAQALRDAPAGPAQLQYGLTPSHYVSPATIEYASFWARFVASLIDGFLMQLVNGLLQALLSQLFYILELPGGQQVSGLKAMTWAATMCSAWLYEAIMESSRHQATLGKMAMKLVVTDVQGKPITFARATGRHFGKILSSMICLLGYFAMLWNPRHQTWHDQLAGTLVIKRPQ
jgi:uncharacterized RDD family membrane protein YckC